MVDSILASVKQLLNVEQSITAFDAELIMHINAALAELIQSGIGPDEGFLIDENTEWSEFTEDARMISNSLEYVYCKTKLIWDPPANSFTCDALKSRAEECYWRAYITANENKSQNGSEG